MIYTYLIEQSRWDDNYYHIVNAKTFTLDKLIEDYSYFKNGSYFTITRLEDEVQTKRKRTRSKQNVE